MNRRRFLAAGMCAPAAALLTACDFSLEQGLMNECRAPSKMSPEAAAMMAQAWSGLRAADTWDCHVHLFGNGHSDTRVFLGASLDRPSTVADRARRAFFMNGGCVSGDEARFDPVMVARLTALVEQLPPGSKAMLLAFDFAHDDQGEKHKELTTFAVSDAYARDVARSRPDRFEWIASIHPYRGDAIAALEQAKQEGARAVKWLPSTMAMDPSSPRCRPFYDALQRLDVPLLIHMGEEKAAHGAGRAEYCNPLHLRHPLDAGVRVIAAHCASLGTSPDLDANRDESRAPQVANFDLFTRLMDERRYEGRLYGDISALTQANRASVLRAFLERAPGWDGRLLNGSDYPLPGILPLFSMNRMVSDGFLAPSALPALRDLRQCNPLAFDFVLKRNLALDGKRIPASAFETRPFFDNSQGTHA